MISWVQISVLISYAYDIMGMIDMYDFMVIKSLYDFMESWNHIWYLCFEYQWWYHIFQEMKSLNDFTAWCLPWFYKFCIGFHALKSFLNSWNHIYDPHFRARAGPVLLRFSGGSSLLQSNDAFMQYIFSYNKIMYDTLLQRVAGDCGAPATLLLSRRCRARA